MPHDPHRDDAYHGDDSYYDRWGQPAPWSREEEEAQALEAHERRLAVRDRLWEKGESAHLPFRHFNRTERQERREAKDERRARALLRPTTGEVDVQPRDVPLDEAA